MDENVDPFNGIKDMRLDSCGVFIRMKGGFYASEWWGKQAYCCILIFLWEDSEKGGLPGWEL